MSDYETPDPEGSGASSRPDEDVVDLDALRAKRLEGAPVREVKFGGRIWRLVPEVPFGLGEAYRQGERRSVVAMLLAEPIQNGTPDDEWDPKDAKAALVADFMALSPSEQDVGALIGAYGLTSGKSSASSRP